MGIGIGRRLKKELKRPVKDVKSAGRSIDEEITQPLFGDISSQPSAAEAATPSDEEAGATIIESRRVSALKDETRRRSTQKVRGRKSTILAGADPDLVSASRSKRKTLFGG